MIGRIVILAAFFLVAVNFKILFGIVVVLMVGFNLAHGRAEYPCDYHPRSRGPVSWRKKINPVWWTLNDDDPITLPKNDKHFPDDPTWLRKVKWWIRNPTCNLDRYVLGFWDKRDWWARERPKGSENMWPLPGESWAVCLPFISYHGKRFEFYTGWKPNSEFGWICLRRK